MTWTDLIPQLVFKTNFKTRVSQKQADLQIYLWGNYSVLEKCFFVFILRPEETDTTVSKNVKLMLPLAAAWLSLAYCRRALLASWAAPVFVRYDPETSQFGNKLKTKAFLAVFFSFFSNIQNIVQYKILNYVLYIQCSIHMCSSFWSLYMI